MQPWEEKEPEAGRKPEGMQREKKKPGIMQGQGGERFQKKADRQKADE